MIFKILKRPRLNRSRAFAALLALAVTAGATAQTLIVNVNGYTSSADGLRQFTAFAVDGNGRIADTYKKHPALAGYKVIDGGGHTVLPGLIDAHGHVQGLGKLRMQLDLTGSSSKADALARFERYAGDNKTGAWLYGFGWNQELWPSRSFPSAKDIDALETERCVVLERVDGHAVWVNSAALKRAGITRATPDPKGGAILKDEIGEPNGILVDLAANLVTDLIPPPTGAEKRTALTLAMRELNTLGITSAHDAGVDIDIVRIFQALADEGKMTARIYAMLSDAGENLDAMGAPLIDAYDGMLSVRSVKLYADGALGSRGAALIAPYSDAPENTGLLFNDADTMAAKVNKASGRGYQVNVHAIGDAANRQVLDAFAGLPAKERRALRHRIEHAQVIALEDLARLAHLNVIASMQPTHATSDMNMAENRVGPKRIGGAYAWRRLLENGTHIAAGSDFPVEGANPFWGLYAAVARMDHAGKPAGGWYPGEAMTRAEALHAFTIEGAYAAHQENSLGSLERGKWADFIVIDRDYFEVPVDEIWQIKVHETWVAGRPVYGAGAILRGAEAL